MTTPEDKQEGEADMERAREWAVEVPTTPRDSRRKEEVAMHPFAITGHRNGALGMKAGDRVRYRIDGRTGVADEFTHDGEAYVTWDDGTYGIVKWNHLEPAP